MVRAPSSFTRMRLYRNWMNVPGSVNTKSPPAAPELESRPARFCAPPFVVKLWRIDQGMNTPPCDWRVHSFSICSEISVSKEFSRLPAVPPADRSILPSATEMARARLYCCCSFSVSLNEGSTPKLQFAFFPSARISAREPVEAWSYAALRAWR